MMHGSEVTEAELTKTSGGLAKEFRLLQKARTENFVTFHKGELPILLVAPHGGTKQPEDITEERDPEKGYKTRSTETFSNDLDENTYELTWWLADKLYEENLAAPYVVTADFARKYVDADRDNRLLGVHDLPYENHAYDDPAGQKYYDQYHNKIREYVKDIKERLDGEGFLFDIHGSVLKNNKIIVGMVTYDPMDFQRNFRRGHVSVDSLIARLGFDPLYHPVTGFISALNGKPLPEGFQTEVMPSDRFQKASFSGDLTVITYGSNRPGGINAFHLECSQKLRTQWLENTVEIYTEAIQTLYRNVIDAPSVIHTIFAGKRHLGQKVSGKTVTSTTFDFPIHYTPKRGYPAMIHVHTRNLKSNHYRVMLNDYHLGNLKPRHLASFFEVDNKGLGQLKKEGNQLTISLDTTQNENEEELYIVKVDVLCSCI